jgi:hypothetical protein
MAQAALRQDSYEDGLADGEKKTEAKYLPVLEEKDREIEEKDRAFEELRRRLREAGIDDAPPHGPKIGFRGRTMTLSGGVLSVEKARAPSRAFSTDTLIT